MSLLTRGKRRTNSEWITKLLQPPCFEEAGVAGSVDEDMIVQLDADGLAGFFDPVRDFDVGGRGLQAAIRAVVGGNDAGGAISPCVGRHFSWMSRRSVHEPDGQDADVQDFVCPVRADAEDVLLLAVRMVADERQASAGAVIFRPSGFIQS